MRGLETFLPDSKGDTNSLEEATQTGEVGLILACEVEQMIGGA